MAAVSLEAVKVASERAMGGEGCRLLTAGAALAFAFAFALRAPLALRLDFFAEGAMPLSASLRSLLSASASASSSTSLGTEASLCESSARSRSVTTDLLSSSSSSLRGRARLAVLFRAGAMMGVLVCGGWWRRARAWAWAWALSLVYRVGVVRPARERSRAVPVRCGAFCGLGSGRLGQVGGQANGRGRWRGCAGTVVMERACEGEFRLQMQTVLRGA